MFIALVVVQVVDVVDVVVVSAILCQKNKLINK